MPNRLTNVETLEVSLVTRGANKKKFALTKSEDPKMDELSEILKAVLETEIESEAQLEELFKLNKVSDGAMDAVRAALRSLSGFKDEIPGNVMNGLMAMVGAKTSDVPKQKPEYPAPKAKTLKSNDNPEPEGISKEMQDKFETLFKAQQEELTKANDRAEKFEKSLDIERHIRLSKEATQKAEENFGLLGNPEDIGGLLKSLTDTNPELAEKVEKVFFRVPSLALRSNTCDVRPERRTVRFP